MQFTGRQIAILFFSLHITAELQAQTEEAKPWPAPVLQDHRPKVDVPGFRFDDLAFDAVEDLDLLDFSFGDLDTHLDLGREVFANRDLEGSYTVLDKMR